MTIGCRVNWQNFIKSAFLSLSVLRHLTFRQISRRPVVVEGWEYHHSTRLDLPVRMAELFDETSKWRSTECDKNADLMKFCQLTRHPMVMEEWEYHHSTRLDEPVRMVVFSFVYDHWTPRYLTKRQMAQYRK